MRLPEEFIERMRAQLGEELDSFLNCYRLPAFRGVRLNPLKCGEEVLRRNLPFSIESCGFSNTCFYAEYDEGFGRLPAHHAGMFYSQEPSASSAVEALDPQPGERILDLCAAPGGKATQIAGRLMGSGLVWANEVVRGRTGALLSNMERMGAAEAVVSCCHPKTLCLGLRGFFHRVLVDAPCSGEGMFRRDPEAISQWSPEAAGACATRQLAILDCAAKVVGDEGVLVYSTCTFSKEENEDVAAEFLRTHPGFVAERIQADFGRPDLAGGLGRRIYPMDGGEGHFVARFRRVGENPCRAGAFRGYLAKKQSAEAEELYQSLFTGRAIGGRLVRHRDCVLVAPEDLPELAGLGVLRAGVELCYEKSGRLEPAHGAFMAHSGEECRVKLEPESEELMRFLRGEEICAPQDMRGYAAVCVDKVTVGFGKASAGRLKNRYPKGLRNLK